MRDAKSRDVMLSAKWVLSAAHKLRDKCWHHSGIDDFVAALERKIARERRKK